MKLVIEISEEDYTNIEPFLNGETIKGGFNLFKTLEIIKNGIPFDNAFKTITDSIKEEADYAYADFNKYKEDVLGAELDELPDDDFRYGLNRAVEIISIFEFGEGINGKYRGDDKENS